MFPVYWFYNVLYLSLLHSCFSRTECLLIDFLCCPLHPVAVSPPFPLCCVPHGQVRKVGQGLALGQQQHPVIKAKFTRDQTFYGNWTLRGKTSSWELWSRFFQRHCLTHIQSHTAEMVFVTVFNTCLGSCAGEAETSNSSFNSHVQQYILRLKYLLEDKVLNRILSSQCPET